MVERSGQELPDHRSYRTENLVHENLGSKVRHSFEFVGVPLRMFFSSTPRIGSRVRFRSLLKSVHSVEVLGRSGSIGGVDTGRSRHWYAPFLFERSDSGRV